jgi:hypothetical protein
VEWSGVDKGVGPEFKPQYHTHTHTKNPSYLLKGNTHHTIYPFKVYHSVLLE